MKIGICGDLHYSQNSSIVRKNGFVYSMRLENCIDTINWVEQTFEQNKVDMEVYLGDFFDKDTLNSQEITAFSCIKWNSIPKNFLVGNHEMGLNDLRYSTSHLFASIGHNNIINAPVTMWPRDDIELCFLPYVLEQNRKPSIVDYFGDGNNRYIFSHNDIKGIQMGCFESKIGFDIDDISSHCIRFINGHIHNGAKINDQIINIGNVTGQNFSEDASIYDHHIFILDTESNVISAYNNPHALNFYKKEYSSLEDIKLDDFIYPAVVSCKCPVSISKEVKEQLNNCKSIIENRVIIDTSSSDVDAEELVDQLSVDHLARFQQYVMEKIGNDKMTLEELSVVCQ